jgi:HSP20 family protein
MMNWIRTEEWPRAMMDDLAALQGEFNRLFGADGLPGRAPRFRYPPLNVWQSEDGVVVDVELPGVEADSVDVTVANGVLTVSGKRDGMDDEKVGNIRRERATGDFSRSVRLPFRVEEGGIAATYRHGVLRISLPRAEEDKPKRITVKAA